MIDIQLVKELKIKTEMAKIGVAKSVEPILHNRLLIYIQL